MQLQLHENIKSTNSRKQLTMIKWTNQQSPVAKFFPSDEKQIPPTESPWPLSVFKSNGWCLLLCSCNLSNQSTLAYDTTKTSIYAIQSPRKQNHLIRSVKMVLNMRLLRLRRLRGFLIIRIVDKLGFSKRFNFRFLLSEVIAEDEKRNYSSEDYRQRNDGNNRIHFLSNEFLRRPVIADKREREKRASEKWAGNGGEEFDCIRCLRSVNQNESNSRFDVFDVDDSEERILINFFCKLIARSEHFYRTKISYCSFLKFEKKWNWSFDI